MKVKAYDIDYDISYEDAVNNLERLGIDTYNEDKINAYIDRLYTSLPKEIIIDVEHFDDINWEEDEGMLDDYVANKISDKTGWLVNSFMYDILDDNEFVVELPEEFIDEIIEVMEDLINIVDDGDINKQTKDLIDRSWETVDILKELK